MANQVPIFVGAALTLLVIVGYLLGENNFLFRLATYIFVGVAAGFVFMIIIYQVLIPRLILPLTSGISSQMALAVFPLLFSVMLMFKVYPRLSGIGSVPMAYLVGVGAAVAIGGAVLGTLITQARATVNLFDLQTPGGAPPIFRLLDGIGVLLGTISTLMYFSFSASARRNLPPERPAAVRFLAKIGQIFIAVTLGSLFAGVFTAALTAFIERLSFLLNVIRSISF
jgi:hypothetical protein